MDQNPWHTNPPSHLAGTIIGHIKSDVRHKTTLTISLYSVVILSALGAFIPAYSYMSREIARTGFYEFLTLTYSDSALVMTHWQEMIFTLLESLPVVGMAVVLTLMLILLSSLRMIAHESRGKIRAKTI